MYFRVSARVAHATTRRFYGTPIKVKCLAAAPSKFWASGEKKASGPHYRRQRTANSGATIVYTKCTHKTSPWIELFRMCFWAFLSTHL